MADNLVQRHPRKVAAGGALGAAAAIIALSGPMIDRYEGNILVGYLDPVKIATEGRGHTGPDVRVGHAITMAESDRLFDVDQRAVIAAVGRCTKVDVPIESFAAFTSFSFNLGAGTYCHAIAPRVNAGDLAGACAALGRYTLARAPKSGCPRGTLRRVTSSRGDLYCELPGLVDRRIGNPRLGVVGERTLCEEGLR